MSYAPESVLCESVWQQPKQTAKRSTRMMTDLPKTSHAGEYQQKVCTWLFEKIGGSNLIPASPIDDAMTLGADIHALAFNGVNAAVDASIAEFVPRAAGLLTA